MNLTTDINLKPSPEYCVNIDTDDATSESDRAVSVHVVNLSVNGSVNAAQLG